MRELQELLHRELMHAMVTGAYAQKLSLQSDAIAFALSSHLSVVNVPVTGLEKLDFKSMLDGHVPEHTPVMYWYLAGEVLNESAFPLSEGFYTVVVHQQLGTVELRDTKGQTVAQGGLEVCVGPGSPPTGAIFRTKVTGGIDSASASLWPPHVKICGHVKVQKDGVTITVTACVEAGF
ncbi:MAG: hypothetical protein QM706_01300 [Nitrospira sp.]